jgi:hypothetical protein
VLPAPRRFQQAAVQLLPCMDDLLQILGPLGFVPVAQAHVGRDEQRRVAFVGDGNTAQMARVLLRRLVGRPGMAQRGTTAQQPAIGLADRARRAALILAAGPGRTPQAAAEAAQASCCGARLGGTRARATVRGSDPLATNPT